MCIIPRLRVREYERERIRAPMRAVFEQEKKEEEGKKKTLSAVKRTHTRAKKILVGGDIAAYSYMRAPILCVLRDATQLYIYKTRRRRNDISKKKIKNK